MKGLPERLVVVQLDVPDQYARRVLIDPTEAEVMVVVYDLIAAARSVRERALSVLVADYDDGHRAPRRWTLEVVS